MVDIAVLEARIREAIPDAEIVRIEDLTGTRDHFDALIVAPSFAGLTRIAQHQTIYKALGDLMAGPVHALALRTYTPDAWRKTTEESTNGAR